MCGAAFAARVCRPARRGPRRAGAILDGPLRGPHRRAHPALLHTVRRGRCRLRPGRSHPVDPRLGDWADVRRLAAAREVTADLIVNHISAGSAEFRDWQARGSDRPRGNVPDAGPGVSRRGHRGGPDGFYRPGPGCPSPRTRSAAGGAAGVDHLHAQPGGPRRRAPGRPGVHRPDRGGAQRRRAWRWCDSMRSAMPSRRPEPTAS